MQKNNRFPDPGAGLRGSALAAAFVLAIFAAGIFAGIALQWSVGCVA